MNLQLDWIAEAAMRNKGQCHADGDDFVPMLFVEGTDGEVAIVPWFFSTEMLGALTTELRADSDFIAGGFVADAYTYLSPTDATTIDEAASTYERGTAAERFAAGDPDAKECLIFTMVTRDGDERMRQVPYHFDGIALVFDDPIDRTDEELGGIVIDALRTLVTP